MKSTKLYILLFVYTLFVGNSLMAENNKWPIIKNSSISIDFSEQGPRSYNYLITDSNGVPVYLLESYLSAYDFENPDYEYSGDFECRLTPLYEKTSGVNLLTYTQNQIRSWENRGRFLLNEMQNKKAENIGWGRRRSFRLRGMIISLEITDYKIEEQPNKPKWAIPGRHRIGTLSFKATFRNDASIKDSIDEESKYSE